jgi:nitroreductase
MELVGYKTEETLVTATTIERSEVGTTGIDVLEAIRTRRSTGKVRQEPLPREVIEELLEAASWAPNHHVTQPWRFVVIAGAAREALGEVMGRAKVARLDPATADTAAEYERARNKALRAPVIIAVVVEIPVGSTAVEVEEIAAGAAATQNLLLAAHGLGLGAMWRTGDAAYDPNVKAFLGFKPTDHIIGFVYLGYPNLVPTRHKHTPAAELTRWLGWNEVEI